jgi:SAM-dependent methyltransferase
VASALRIYGEVLRAGARSGTEPYLRLRDGTVVRLPLERWLGPADAAEQQALEGLDGPVLDVGCGPGRHLRALAARGIFALGIDLSPVAVKLAIDGGDRAIVGDIFEEVPGAGHWACALLLDGNVGIGGSPVRLLARLSALLKDGGKVLVELESPEGSTCSTQARIERDGVAGEWFPWARVAAPVIGTIARAGGFRTAQVWSASGRWFARLQHDDLRSRSMRQCLPKPRPRSASDSTWALAYSSAEKLR